MTFAESDFSHYLEKFCEGLRDRMFAVNWDAYPDHSSFASPHEFFEAFDIFCKARNEMNEKRSKLMRPENRFSKDSEEYMEICNEVKRLWHEYAESVDMQRWAPDVSIQYSLEEKWENGEVVYYFTPYDKFITQ
jgi:hypothetical protein